MSPDIVLVTVESWRYDYRDELPLPDGFETVEGITAGHYTRPALAGLLTGRYRDAAQAAPDSPTLAGRLADVGYTTIGVCYSPQTAIGMGFGEGFDKFDAIEPSGGPFVRGSKLRERLAQFGPIRALHRRFKPKTATLDGLPTDDSALRAALKTYDDAESPRFCWVHLMDTHRPYGRGQDALPAKIDAKAAGVKPGGRRSMSATEHEQVVSHYRMSLRRSGDRLSDFLDRLGDEAVVVVAGDHGEEFGESGYYYHGGYRQRLVDTLVRVPVAVKNLRLCGDRVSAIDLTATLAAAAGAEMLGLDGLNRQWHPNPSALTVAPWAGSVKSRWTGESSVVYLGDQGARPVHSTSQNGSTPAVKQQLEALGYVGDGG